MIATAESSLQLAYGEAVRHVSDATTLLVRAEAALDAGDTEELLRLIRERAEVLRACEEPLAVLRRAAESDHASGEARRLFEAFVSQCAEVSAGEGRLALSLESERERVGRELDQIEGDEIVRSAYGMPIRGQARFNTVG